MDAHVKAYEKHRLSIIWGIGIPSEPKIYLDMKGHEYSNGLTISDMLDDLVIKMQPDITVDF